MLYWHVFLSLTNIQYYFSGNKTQYINIIMQLYQSVHAQIRKSPAGDTQVCV